MKLCVFPNDPLQAYYDKGEIKERYYNPNNKDHLQVSEEF